MPLRIAPSLAASLATLACLSGASAADTYCLRNSGPEPVLLIAEQTDGSRRARPTAPGGTWCVPRAGLSSVAAFLDEMAVEAGCRHAPSQDESGLTLVFDGEGETCVWKASD